MTNHSARATSAVPGDAVFAPPSKSRRVAERSEDVVDCTASVSIASPPTRSLSRTRGSRGCCGVAVVELTQRSASAREVDALMLSLRWTRFDEIWRYDERSGRFSRLDRLLASRADRTFDVLLLKGLSIALPSEGRSPPPSGCLPRCNRHHRTHNPPPALW